MKQIMTFIRWGLISIALLVVVTLSLLPFMIRWQGVAWLEQQGLDAAIGYVEIRPMLGTIQVNDIRIRSASGEQLRLDQLLLNIAWTPLFEHNIHIEDILLEGLAVDLAVTPSGLRVGGIPLPVTEKQAAQDVASSPLFKKLQLEQFQLRNLTFCYLLMNDRDEQQANQCAGLDALRLNDLTMALGETPSLSLPGVSLRGLRWFDRLDPLVLAAIESLTVTGVNSPDMARWQLGKLHLQSLGLLPGGSAALRLSELQLSGLNLAEDVVLDDLSLDAIAVGLELDPANGLAFAPALLKRVSQLSPEPSSQVATDASGGGETGDRQIRLNQFALRQLDMGADRPILSAGELRLGDVDVGGSAFALKTMSLGSVFILPGTEDALAMNGLAVKGLKLGQKNTTIADISLAAIDFRLQLNDEGRLVFAPVLMAQIEASMPQPSTIPPDSGQDTDTSSGAIFLDQFRLDAMRISADRPLLSVGNVTLSGMNMAGAAVAMNRLTLDDLNLLPGNEDALVLDRFEMQGLDVNRDVAIAGLSLGDLQMRLETNAQGAVAFAPTLIRQLTPMPKKNDSVAEGIDLPSEKPAAMGFEIGDLQLGSLAVFADRELLSLDTLGLQQLKLVGDQVEMARLEVSTVDFLAPAPGFSEVSHYVQIPRLSLDKLAKNSGTLSLAKMEINDPEIFVHRDADGILSMFSELTGLLGQNGQSGERAQQLAPPLKVQLGSLLIGHQGQLRILDESVSPPLNQRFTGLELRVSNLDGTRSDARADVSLNMALNQFGTLSMSGQLDPFGDRLTAVVGGAIKGIDVRDITGYAKKFSGYHLDQGLVDADISVDIREDNIDATVITRFHKLQVSPVSKADLDAGASELGVPLEFALSLLRDSNGMIELKLPISGNVNSPTFSIRHIVNKVMFKVIKETVINYYLPFGLVMKTLVGDSLAGMGFEPVVFAPGTAALDEAGEANLDRLSDMLQKRQQLQLVFCAPATLQDWAAQFSPDNLAILQSSVENPLLPETTTEQSDGLTALANQRTAASKQYLIDRGIDPGQMILCTGKFDQTSTRRPEMSIAIGQ